MLTYLHLHRAVLPNDLEWLKDQIISLYPFLINRLFPFLFEAKNSIAIRESILLLQSIKQAQFPFEPQATLPTKPCINDTSQRIHVRHPNLRGTDQIYTESELSLRFYVALNMPTDEEVDEDMFELKLEEEIRDRQEKAKGSENLAITPLYPKVVSYRV
jgi:hypothetical protein